MAGCFMLEIREVQTLDDCTANDPIFSSHGKLYIIPFLSRDMLVLKFCSSNGLMSITNVDRLHIPDGLHILDIYRKSLLIEANPKKAPKHHGGRHLQMDSGGDEIIQSASDLHETGIRIKKVKNGSLRDISFKNWVLKLPVIVVDKTTETIFLNLIAFECLHVGAGNDLTSYIFFMDNIIDGNRDIALLHSRGVIQSTIESDKAAAKLLIATASSLRSPSLKPSTPSSHSTTINHSISSYLRPNATGLLYGFF